MTGRRGEGQALALGWLPRVQAIERCSDDGSRCDYLAWLVVLPDRTAITGALGGTARDVTLWPSVDDALAAFGPGTVVDDSPTRHMTPDEAAQATGSIGPGPASLRATEPTVVVPDGSAQLGLQPRGRGSMGGVVVPLARRLEQPADRESDAVERRDRRRG